MVHRAIYRGPSFSYGPTLIEVLDEFSLPEITLSTDRTVKPVPTGKKKKPVRKPKKKKNIVPLPEAPARPLDFLL